MSEKAPGPRPHLDIAVWLSTLELPNYARLFSRFSGVEEVLDVNREDLGKLGVSNPSHRSRILASLSILKAKYKKALLRRSQPSPDMDGYVSLRTDSNRNNLEPVKSRLSKDLDNNYDLLPNQNGKKLALSGSRCLRDQLWYHGKIGRKEGEEALKEQGEFLVRDCLSQPGDQVLSCRWGGDCLHFMINRIVLPLTLEETVIYGATQRVAYQFEEEQFSTIPDLVDFYLTHSKPVTELSRCVISTSVPKRFSPKPDSLIQNDENEPGGYAVMNRRLPVVPKAGIQTVPRTNPNLLNRPLPTPPKMPLSQRVILTQANRSLAKSSSESKLASLPSEETLTRFQSAQNLRLRSGPTKPSRAPSLRNTSRPTLIVRNARGSFQEILPEEDDDYLTPPDLEEHDYCDIDYAEMDDKPSLPPPLPPKLGEVERDSACVPDIGDLYDVPNPFCKLVPNIYDIPNPSARPVPLILLTPGSKINLGGYCSHLLEKDNKPIEGTVCERIIELLLDKKPKEIAAEITKEDCRFLGFLDSGSLSDLSLLMLPQGCLLRNDLLERSTCMSLFVSISILKGRTAECRTRLLQRWIEVARSLRFHFRNLFGFHNVIKGLKNKSIEKLNSAWHSLRSEFTDSAVCFETSLRPTINKLERGEGALSGEEGLLIPYLLPQLLMMEGRFQKDAKLHDWEDFDPYFGLDAVFKWLCEARFWNGEVCLELAMAARKLFPDEEEEEEMWKTEFQMRFLWGQRGAMVGAGDRYAKFEQLLALMAGKVELDSRKSAGANV